MNKPLKKYLLLKSFAPDDPIRSSITQAWNDNLSILVSHGLFLRAGMAAGADKIPLDGSMTSISSHGEMVFNQSCKDAGITFSSYILCDVAEAYRHGTLYIFNSPEDITWLRILHPYIDHYENMHHRVETLDQLMEMELQLPDDL